MADVWNTYATVACRALAAEESNLSFRDTSKAKGHNISLGTALYSGLFIKFCHWEHGSCLILSSHYLTFTLRGHSAQLGSLCFHQGSQLSQYLTENWCVKCSLKNLYPMRKKEIKLPTFCKCLGQNKKKDSAWGEIRLQAFQRNSNAIVVTHAKMAFLFLSLFSFIRLPCFIMQEDQKTHKHHERKLGKGANAKNLTKDYQVNDLGETELASGWVWDSRINWASYMHWPLRIGRCNTSGILFLYLVFLCNWKTANSRNAVASDPYWKRWLLKAERMWGKMLASYLVVLSPVCYTAWQIEQHFHDVYMCYNAS